MRWTRLPLYFVVAITALLAITVSIALIVDLGRFKGKAEVFVSDLLNRELSIDGPLHLTLGRSIELSAEDVHLAGTDWSADADIVFIDRIEASLNTWSLISGPIMIESLVVDGVRINLEHNENGENNWTFFAANNAAEAEESDVRPQLPVLSDNSNISDLKLVYDNPKRPRPFQFSGSSIEEKIDDKGHVQLALDGQINETPVALNVSAGRVQDLIDYRDVDFEFSGNLGEIMLSGEAELADLLHPARPLVRLNVDGPNVEYLTDRLRLERVTTGPLSLEINIGPINSRQQLSVQGDIGEFKLIANGQFVDLRQLDEFDLNLSASGPDASTLGRVVGAANAPPDPFNIIGSFHRAGSNIAIEGLSVTVGETHFNMQADFDDFPSPSSANGTVRLDGPDIGRFSNLLGLPGKLDGPFKLDADLAPLDGGGAAVDIIASANDLLLKVSGNIVDAEKFVGTDLNAHFEGPSLKFVTDTYGLQSGPDEPFSLDIGVDRVEDGVLIRDGALSVGENQLRFSGVVGNEPLKSGTDIRFDLAGPNFARLLDAFGRDADELPYAQYRLSGRIERVPDNFVLHDIIVAIGANLDYELSADGTITDQPRLLGSRIRIGARGDSIGAITDAAGIEGIPGLPFDLAATVEFLDRGYSIQQGSAQIGDDQATVSGLIGVEPLSRDTNVDFEVSAPNLKNSLASYGIEISQLPAGELIASGAIRSEGGNLSIQEIATTFAGATAKVEGKIGALPSLDGTDVRLEISGSDLSRLLPPIDAVRGLNKPFSLNTGVRLGDNSLEINSARVRIDQTRLTLDIDVGLDPFLSHGEFSIQGDSPDLFVLFPQATEVAVPKTARFDLVTGGKWSNNVWTFSKFDLGLGAGNISIEGTIDGPPDFGRTDLRFDWQISSLDNFDIIAGRDLPDLPARLKFRLLGTTDVITIEAFDGLIGQSEINANFSLRTGDVPNIKLSVSADNLNLTPFLPPEPEADSASPPAQPNKRDVKRIPDTPVPVDFLKKFVADADVRVGEIHLGQRVIRDLVLHGSVAGGEMHVSEISAKGSRGGDFTGRLAIRPNGSGADFGMRMFGTDLAFGLPAYTRDELDQLPVYDMDLGFVTAGRTVREMAGAANGYLRLLSGEGRVRRGSMSMLTSDFLTQVMNTVNPFIAEDHYVNLKCVAVLAAVENGQLSGKPGLVVQSEKLNIFANTKVDLKTEKLDVTFNTVPQKGLGISLSNLVNPYVKVNGTLGNPTLSLDPEGALIQGGAAVATAGLSILAKGFADRFLSSKDPCGKAVSDADEKFQILLDKYGKSGAKVRK